MSFITDFIRDSMYSPNTWEKAHNTHVEDTVKHCKVRRDIMATPMRPDGYWRGGKMTVQNRVDQMPGKLHNGHCVVGIDKNGNALSANSLDTALAVLDAQYTREIEVEKFLAAEREKKK